MASQVINIMGLTKFESMPIEAAMELSDGFKDNVISVSCRLSNMKKHIDEQKTLELNCSFKIKADCKCYELREVVGKTVSKHVGIDRLEDKHLFLRGDPVL